MTRLVRASALGSGSGSSFSSLEVHKGEKSEDRGEVGVEDMLEEREVEDAFDDEDDDERALEG